MFANVKTNKTNIISKKLFFTLNKSIKIYFLQIDDSITFQRITHFFFRTMIWIRAYAFVFFQNDDSLNSKNFVLHSKDINKTQLFKFTFSSGSKESFLPIHNSIKFCAIFTFSHINSIKEMFLYFKQINQNLLSKLMFQSHSFFCYWKNKVVVWGYGYYWKTKFLSGIRAVIEKASFCLGLGLLLKKQDFCWD